MTTRRILYLLIPPTLALLLLIGWSTFSGVAQAAQAPFSMEVHTELEPDRLDGKEGIKSPDQCTPDTPDIVSYWPLNDGTGAMTFDDVIGANDGACSLPDCPASKGGIVSTGFEFDGFNDRILVPDSPTLNWLDDNSLSFEMWVNTVQDCTDNKVFLGKYGGPLGSSWWVGCTDGGFAVFSLKDTDKVKLAITGTVAINDANWHHIVAVRDASADSNSLYVDAVLDVSDTINYTGVFSNTGELALGNHFNSYFLDGLLDEVALYDRALTPAEIQAHYNAGAGQSYCEGNQPPNVTHPGDQSNQEGESVSLQIMASDPEMDALTYSADGLPPNLNINATSGLISGAIAFGASSSSPYTVEVSAVDTGALSDSEVFVWTVTGSSQAPVVTNPGNQSNMEGQSVNLQIIANDPNSDPLTYTATGLPPNLNINATTGKISGSTVLGAATNSPYTVKVTATDPGSLSDTETFTWTVLPFTPPPGLSVYLPLIIK